MGATYQIDRIDARSWTLPLDESGLRLEARAFDGRRVAVSAWRGGSLLHRDVVTLAHARSRARYVRAIGESGVTLTEAPLLALDEAIRRTPREEPPRDAPPDSSERASIDLAGLLAELREFIARYVVMTPEQAIAVTMWVVHTHAAAAADCTPYLHITSPVKRTGKTRLLEVLETVVARAWLTGRTTAAALVRKIDAEQPTLLLDESDAAFSGSEEYAEALRAVLNSGYRRSGKATVCVGQGSAVHAHDFATFCAKAIAGIGRLPDTVADRSIPIALRRRTRHEPVSRWRERDGRRAAAPIHAALAQWAASAVAALRDARPALPQTLSDRGMDVWEPLLAIADAAGGDWAERAREVAMRLMGEIDDDSIGVQLLADLREVFGESDALPSAEIVRRLADRDDRPWATWSKGKPITGHALARVLRPFGVVPAGAMRVDGVVTRAYRRATFADAWARYLPDREVETSVAPPEASVPIIPDPPAERSDYAGDGLF